MTAEIIHLTPEVVGDGVRVAPDAVLTAAIGKCSSVVVIGEQPDGNLYFAASDGVRDTMWLIETAKHVLLEPDA